MLNVVLAGGGHAMLPVLRAAKRWREAGIAKTTLFDPQPSLYYSGMIPEYLGGVYRAEQARIDLAPLCQRAGVRFRQQPLMQIDAAQGTITDATGDATRYDVLALDVGGRNPELPDAAFPTKPLHRLPDVEARIRSVLADKHGALSLCIVGGGAAGIELLLNVTARFLGAGRSTDLSATLIEATESLLPGFPTGMQQHVASVLSERGVDVRLNEHVTTVDGSGVTTRHAATGQDHRVQADTVLWATGVQGPPLLRDSALPLDARSFVRVTDTLQVHDHPRIFAAGDCATITGRESLAKVGVHAVKQGPDLAANLDRTVRTLRKTGILPDSSDLRRFRPYAVAPLILSTGTREGIWTAGDVWWRGTAALRLKHWVDRRWIRAYNDAWPAWGTSLARPDAPL